MKGLLGQPEYATGLLGAATANPNMARQFANARQNMTAPTSVMDERYPAWKKSQDQAEQFLLAADFVSSAIPAALMAAPYAKKGLLAAGKTLAPKVENYMARTGLLQPATVWHGSPHRFDKFDASKIGTGEGAQAYGHGLYFAESPKVAQDYAVTLSAKQGKVGGSVNNKPIYDAYKALEAQANRTPAAQAGPMYNKLDLLERLGMNELPDDVLKYAQSAYGTNSKEVAWLQKEIIPKYKGAGHLYKVDLPDEAIAKMLDWDKPLSQQASVAPMLDALQTAPELPAGFGQAIAAARARKHFDGNDLFAELVKVMPNAQASEVMKRAGFPGIRYLDGGSRGAGAGTSNYVVFPGNESLLKILSRE